MRTRRAGKRGWEGWYGTFGGRTRREGSEKDPASSCKVCGSTRGCNASSRHYYPIYPPSLHTTICLYLRGEAISKLPAQPKSRRPRSQPNEPGFSAPQSRAMLMVGSVTVSPSPTYQNKPAKMQGKLSEFERTKKRKWSQVELDHKDD